MDSLITIVVTAPHSPTSSWLQWMSALGPLLIGLAVAAIAFRQWRTAQAKVKLDLFDRRVKVYDAVRVLHAQCRTALNTREPATDDFDIDRYPDAFKDSRWLYNEEISNYLHRELFASYVIFSETIRTQKEARGHNAADEESSRELLVDAYARVNECANQARSLLRPFLALYH